MTGKWYEVLSAEYDVVEPVLEDGSGPTTTVRDYCRVRARTPGRAKALMIRAMRRRLPKYQQPDWLTDWCSPFKGMTVTRVYHHQTEDEWLTEQINDLNDAVARGLVDAYDY